ncbi:Flp family type IVb pilin [Neobacillus niacini]|uniref:Flp family type IVb pilin n=1 Tax=Neobacillus niacini TaxID=86668 RepID=UPI003B0236CE
MLKKIKGLFIEEEGQGLSEYGLIIGLVAIACVVALGALATDIGELLGRVGAALDKAK